jgi:hypothetical protein
MQPSTVAAQTHFEDVVRKRAPETKASSTLFVAMGETQLDVSRDDADSMLQETIKKHIAAYLNTPSGKARVLFTRFLKKPICEKSLPWAREYSRALSGLRDETNIYCVSCKTRVWESMEINYKLRCCNRCKCLDDLVDNGEPEYYPFSSVQTRDSTWTRVLDEWRLNAGTLNIWDIR